MTVVFGPESKKWITDRQRLHRGKVPGMKKISVKRVNERCDMPSIILGSYQIQNPSVIREMIRAGFNAGIYGFDTSPSYGNLSIFGESLNAVSDELGIDRKQIFVAGKIDGWQMARTNGDVRKYVLESLRELRLEYYDLLLVHWPFERYLTNTWKVFEALYREKTARSIGICNVTGQQYVRFVNSIDISPQVVQNEISPLNTADADVALFQKAGAVVQAYSPLGRMMPVIRNHTGLKEMAKKHNKDIAQVILRWHFQRGIVPIFTSSKPERIRSNIDINDFELSEGEMQEISRMNQDYKIFPQSLGCPGV